MLNLKTARRLAGLTQQEVANRLGVTQNCYSYWETGKIKIDDKTIETLASIFNVSVDFLLGKSLTTYLPNAKNVDMLDNPIKLPVYGEIRAGVPIDTNQSPTSEWVFEDEKYADGNHFALKVVGDSMDRAGITADVFLKNKKSPLAKGAKMGTVGVPQSWKFAPNITVYCDLWVINCKITK